MNKPVTFVLDTNVFIQAHRQYYSHDICPGFWECLIHYFHNGHVLSLDRVYDEMKDQEDALARWIKAAPENLFVSSDETAIVAEFQKIMTWAEQAGFSSQAIATFASGADGWLVAYAKVYEAVLVTTEKYQENAKARILIPNVCKDFGVIGENTFNLLRKLNVRFGWMN